MDAADSVERVKKLWSSDNEKTDSEDDRACCLLFGLDDNLLL